MKIFLQILLFSLITTNLYSQEWIKDTSWLKGKVKYLEQFSEYGSRWYKEKIEYNREGMMVRHNRFRNNDDDNYNAYYRVFDETGKRVLKKYFIQYTDTPSVVFVNWNSKGLMESSERYSWGDLYLKTTFHYNTNGQLVLKRNVFENGSILIDSFAYDNSGNKIFHGYFSETLKTLKYWVYNKKGLIVEEKKLDSNWASRTTHYIGKDDITDSVVTEDFKYKPNTDESYIVKFEYNEQNLVVKEVKTKTNGDLIHSSIWEYDNNGNQIRNSTYYSEVDKTYVFEYKYRYDKFKNWISSKIYRNGEYYGKETQKIKYF